MRREFQQVVETKQKKVQYKESNIISSMSGFSEIRPTEKVHISVRRCNFKGKNHNFWANNSYDLPIMTDQTKLD